MNKFWKWMDDNGHIDSTTRKEIGVNKIRSGDNYNFVYPTKQMLIGYMMEYMDEVCPTWRDFTVFMFSSNECLKTAWIAQSTTEQRYNWLLAKINELEAKP